MCAKLNVAVLIYPGVEMIDMTCPLDTFQKANSYNDLNYNIYIVAETRNIIQSENKVVTITPDYSIDDCPAPDIIVIPGQIAKDGPGQKFGQGSKKLVAWIKIKGENPKITVMSVCIGAYILAKTGLLKGKNATTHYMAIKEIQKQYPDTTFVKNVRFVKDGNIVTTGGLTSGIDGALLLIKELDGDVIAQQVADTLVYNRETPLPPYTLLPPYDD